MAELQALQTDDRYGDWEEAPKVDAEGRKFPPSEFASWDEVGKEYQGWVVDVDFDGSSNRAKQIQGKRPKPVGFLVLRTAEGSEVMIPFLKDLETEIPSLNPAIADEVYLTFKEEIDVGQPQPMKKFFSQIQRFHGTPEERQERIAELPNAAEVEDKALENIKKELS